MDKLITSAVVVKMQTMNLPVALWQPVLLFPLLLLLARPRLIDRQVIASVHWWHDENMKGERNGGREKKKERKKEREGVINWQRYECKFPSDEFNTSCAATDWCAPLRLPSAPPCAGPSGSAARDRFGSVTSQNMYVSKEVKEGWRESGTRALLMSTYIRWIYRPLRRDRLRSSSSFFCSSLRRGKWFIFRIAGPRPG
jgi:hypothetical protein